jgi:hypothetical protein
LPSIVIYSSFALREILVLCIALIYFYFFIYRKRFLISLIFIITLFLIKPSFGAIYSSISVFYYLFFISNIKNIIKLFITFFILILILIFNEQLLLQLLHIRQGFDSELFGYGDIKPDITLFSETQSLVSLFYTSLMGLINFILSPLSQSLELSKTCLFLENLFLYILIIIYLKKLFKINRLKVCFWVTVLLLMSTFIGIILQNEGTIWRYKLQLLVTILFAIDFSKYKKVY